MEEDLVLSLTRQVKQDVVENYLLERRLIEVQIEHLNNRAEEVRRQAGTVGLRLARLASLTIRPDMQNRLAEILGMKGGSFWISFLDVKFKRGVRFIWARALTRKAKFRKVLLESYSRLYQWTKHYREQYEDLANECSAVNRNIDSFKKNFDLLLILNFLRNLDIQGIEKKKILGDNFTANEMAEVDKKLYIGQVSMEKLKTPAPLDLPEFNTIQGKLIGLVEEVFQRYPEEAKRILR